ncbi:MAG: hypothetical protein NVSMB67_31040 [Flavisolibacter sp.]
MTHSNTVFSVLKKDINVLVTGLIKEYPESVLIELPPVAALREENLLAIAENYSFLHLERASVAQIIDPSSYREGIIVKGNAINYIRYMFPVLLSVLFLGAIPYIQCKSFRLTKEDFQK